MLSSRQAMEESSGLGPVWWGLWGVWAVDRIAVKITVR